MTTIHGNVGGIGTGPVLLDGETLTVEALGALAEVPLQGDGDNGPRELIGIADAAMDKVHACHARALKLAEATEPNYGINTGFGPLCTVTIPPEKRTLLQNNLLLSHAVGVGPLLDPKIVRALIVAKINGLIKGFSGVSSELVNTLAAFVNHDLLPPIPEKGSVGASGDLAPLAHLGLALIGVGNVRLRGREMSAADALAAIGSAPHELRPKEALGLINGTQLMSSCGAVAVHRARRLARTADVIATMSLEALRGSLTPFDERIAAVRPHPGHLAVAAHVRELMQGSEILESHRNCGKVQDPYSLRCVPQVHGAARDAIEHSAGVIERELNSVTDNPIIMKDGTAVSGGNFHGEPLALVLDYAAIALAELASISERRQYLLLEGHDELPALLMKDAGVNSGFMIPQYTSAALVSENKVLCHPASVDSIPTSMGQEDHVSMGSIGATKILRVLDNAETVLAIEALLAAQALDFRSPLRPGRGAEIAWRVVREHIAHADADRLFANDIATAIELVRTGSLLAS